MRRDPERRQPTYAVTWGSQSMRDALVEKYGSWYGMEVDGEREVTVTCGATEAMAAVMLAVIDPGDEVIILEPFYENYGPDTILCEAAPVFLPLEAPHFRLDPDRLAALITDRTRAIVINTPNNPSGRVFDQTEMQAVADLCIEHDLLAITDEIYEHIIYEGAHIPLATLPGMRERTIVISGALQDLLRHRVAGGAPSSLLRTSPSPSGRSTIFLTVGSPAPLQEACAVGMRALGPDYYRDMVEGYRERRDVLHSALVDAGFGCSHPEGAYYIMADFSDLSPLDDQAFSHWLTKECGVAPVPGSSFFHDPAAGASLVRFVFCKRIETLREAGERLRAFFAS